MDWKQFFASVIGSLAWPIVAIAALYIFRSKIVELSDKIAELNLFGQSFKFNRKIEDVTRAAEAVQLERPAEERAQAQDKVHDPHFLSAEEIALAQTSPSAAVLSFFGELEAVLLRIRTKLPDGRPHRTFREVMQYLRKKEYVTPSAVGLFNSLAQAKNAAVHSEESAVNVAEALEYGDKIKILTELLRRVEMKLDAAK